MKTAHFESPLLAFLYVAIALLFAMMQPVLVFVFAFLIPFWLFVADVVNALYPVIRKLCKVFPFLILPVFSPRPPPLR
jgi:fumarate reductase subunit D